jgi:hypothetical protein
MWFQILQGPLRQLYDFIKLHAHELNWKEIED